METVSVSRAESDNFHLTFARLQRYLDQGRLSHALELGLRAFYHAPHPLAPLFLYPLVKQCREQSQCEVGYALATLAKDSLRAWERHARRKASWNDAKAFVSRPDGRDTRSEATEATGEETGAEESDVGDEGDDTNDHADDSDDSSVDHEVVHETQPRGASPMMRVFVEMVDHGLQFELSVAAFYAKERRVGLRLSSGLLLRKVLPWCVRCAVQCNLHYYLEPLRDTSHMELTLPGLGPHWRLLNPSVCCLHHTLHINVRSVNCGGDWSRLYDGHAVSLEHPVVTRNYRCTWTPGATVESKGTQASGPQEAEQSEASGQATQGRPGPLEAWNCQHECPSYGGHVLGLEDLRLFTFRDEVWFMATHYEFSDQGRPMMFLGHDRGGVVLPNPHPGRAQKNWLPFEHEGELLCVYEYEPFTVLRVEPRTGALSSRVTHRYDELDLGSFRGSAPPVRVGDVYLFVVHEVVEQPRRYFHRVLLMRVDDFQLTHISLPFTMRGEHRVEYVCGWALRDDALYVAWGDNDESALLSVVPVASVLRMCMPLRWHLK